jgi:hypothetical protein
MSRRGENGFRGLRAFEGSTATILRRKETDGLSEELLFWYFWVRGKVFEVEFSGVCMNIGGDVLGV